MMVNGHRNKLPGLHGLLEGLTDTDRIPDVQISGVCIDSRDVSRGDLFVAMQGSRKNGNEYIREAANRGAVAVISGNTSGISASDYGIPVCQVPGLNEKLGLIARRFYRDPSASMRITGITGTNGKTSVAHYLATAVSDLTGCKVGSIGTLGRGVAGELEPGLNTTPDVLTINRTLDFLLGKGIDTVMVEVSSHGLDQGRVNYIHFDTAVFTNLSRDHLDYHKDMSAYADAKKRLFDFPGLKNAVINVDDEYGYKLTESVSSSVAIIRYGLTDGTSGHQAGAVDVLGKLISLDYHSMVLVIDSPWGHDELSLSLSGRFNAYNVLACLGVLCIQGYEFTKVLTVLSHLNGVPGRLEFFGSEKSPKVYVDYAHTPDALRAALSSLKDRCTGELVCIFGCGGDRDRGKRPEMGAVAAEFADRIILTNDNPRTEAPEQIIADIRSGITAHESIMVQPDRSAAITEAIRSTGPRDYILIAGKGHETYQEIGTSRYPFSDRQQVRNILEGKT